MNKIYSIYTPTDCEICHIIEDTDPLCNVRFVCFKIADENKLMTNAQLKKHLKKNLSIKVCFKCSTYLSNICSEKNSIPINFRYKG